jgi:hypothetical protein
MPNWCNNHMTVKATPAIIAKLSNALQDGCLLNTFLPMPKESTMDQRCAKWGTKWEITFGNTQVIANCENEISFSFLSAWSPPIQFMESLYELEEVVEVRVYYMDLGMPFCGAWINGHDSDFTDNLNSEEIPYDFWEIMDCCDEYPGREIERIVMEKPIIMNE